MTYRYRVLDFKGKVPDQVAAIAGKEDAYLVYSDFRGLGSLQEFLQDDVVVGCWWMAYEGRAPWSPDKAPPSKRAIFRTSLSLMALQGNMQWSGHLQHLLA